jgi:serine/threonine-protein kinase ULK4
VRRKLVAALGEYLFFVATQIENLNNSSKKTKIEFNSIITTFLLKQIKSRNEDEVVKFYIVKTIENITLSQGQVCQKFCSPETVSILT